MRTSHLTFLVFVAAIVLVELLSYSQAQTTPAPRVNPYAYYLGSNCTRSSVCSESLVCLRGVCNFCQNSTQCNVETQICEHTKFGDVCKHKGLFPNFTYRDILASVFAFLGGALSATGGVGGGGIYVPLLVTLGNFNANMAIAVAKAMILGGSISNFLILAFRRHPKADRPLIDFDAALVLEPTTLAGTVIGVIINKIFPEWIIALCVVVVLSITTVKTFQMGLKKHKQEVAERTLEIETNAAVDEVDVDGPTGSDSALNAEAKEGLLSKEYQVDGESSRPIDEATAEQPEETANKLEVAALVQKERSVPWLKVLVLFVCWVGILTLSLFKGGHGANSVVGIECGSWEYWTLTFTGVPMLIGLTFFCGWYLRREYNHKRAIGYKFLEGDIHWTFSNSVLFPIRGTLAGVLAGLLGIGGGMVKGPIMLDMGVLPEVSAATSNFMILFTASSTTTQFIFMGLLPWDYGLWFGCLGFLASILGQFTFQYFVVKYRKTSIIVFSLAVVIGLSTVLMGTVGIYRAVLNILDGLYMGFKDLCT